MLFDSFVNFAAMAGAVGVWVPRAV